MRKYIKSLEEILQEQIFFRITLGALILLLFGVVFIATKSFYASAALLAIAIWLLISAVYMLYNCILKKYVCIIGECVGVECSSVLHKLKHIYIEAEGKIIKLPMRKRKVRVSSGDMIKVYLPNNSPIIPSSDGYLINQYYAIEIGGEELNE